MPVIHTSLPLPGKIRQIDGLQVLRFVAVGIVAWLHSCQILQSLTGVILPNFGVYGIDIFFVISGFIVSSVVLRTTNEPGLGAMWDFFKRRVIRIFPIYWVFASIACLRLVLKHKLFEHKFLAALFLLPGLAYPGFVELVGFSWTLFFEMFFYYCLAAILLCTVRHAVPISLALLFGAVLLGQAVGTRRPVWDLVCNPILLEFVFGGILSLAYRGFGVRRKFGITLIALGVFLSLYFWIYPPDAANGYQMITINDRVVTRVLTWGISAAMIVGGMIFWSPVIRTPIGRLAVVLGNASYSTYLASALVIEMTTRLCMKLMGTSLPFSTTKLAVYQSSSMIAVFVVGWMCYQFVEWPMLHWLQERSTARK